MSTENKNDTTTIKDNKDNKSKKKWFPLESNPEALNHYISKLGFNTSLYSFVDVYSTDEESLSFLPQGCIGIVMLYPITEVQEEHRRKEAEELAKADTATATATATNSTEDAVWFIKQRIGNACGTIGILHTLGNLSQTMSEITISPASWLHNFYTNTPPTQTTPIEKAEILESDETIEKHHDESTSNSTLNQTSRGSIDDKVLTHFISIANVNNEIYELDGRKECPIRHGSTSDERFLYDGMKVVKKFMERDPNEYRFTILALVPTQD
jgi:ubiquitin carboxyl-terminal hydrolase L3